MKPDSVLNRKVAVWLHPDGNPAKKPDRHWVPVKDVAAYMKGQTMEVAVSALYDALVQVIEALEDSVDARLDERTCEEIKHDEGENPCQRG